MGDMLLSLYYLEKGQPEGVFLVKDLVRTAQSVRATTPTGKSIELPFVVSEDELFTIWRMVDSGVQPPSEDTSFLLDPTTWARWVELHHDLANLESSIAEFHVPLWFESIRLTGPTALLCITDGETDGVYTQLLDLEDTEYGVAVDAGFAFADPTPQ